MSLQINTNVTAMVALNNLNNTSSKISTSIERLSSGLRINTAADDPAGLIISNALQAQITGLNQAVSNSQDAENLIKTAEGGLTEVNNLLNSIRQLAVHAANTGVNDADTVNADQEQINSALASINRIATQTQFGGKNLLDGTAGVNASIVDTQDVAGLNLGGTFNNLSTASGTVSITVNSAATRAQAVGTATFAAINSSLSLVNAGTQGSGSTVVINGQSINVSGSDTVQTLINDINNIAGTTGVSAAFTFGNGSGSVVLTQQTYGSNFAINEAESSPLINGTNGTNVAGTNATVTVTAYSQVNNAPTIQTETFVGGQGSDSGLRVSDSYGNSILLTEQGNTNTAAGFAVGQVTSNSLQFQIGGNAGQFVAASIGNAQATQLGTTAVAGMSLASINVTTAQGASNTLKVVDQAISQISNLEASLGAFQTNTLDSNINSLNVTVENLAASESQIRDTNVAQEVVALTKNQILQSAGMSVLAQANQNPQQVLALLH